MTNTSNGEHIVRYTKTTAAVALIAIAGLALTGYELEQRDRWSPFIVGISQDESKRRLENIERDFGQRRDAALDANRIRPSRGATGEWGEPRPSKRVRVDAEGNVIGN